MVITTNKPMGAYESLQEIFTDKETTEWLKSNWKTGNEIHKLKEFKTSSISDKDYVEIKELISTLRAEDDYQKYKKAFDKLCKMCHIVPQGTIITKYEISKGKNDDENTLYVKYTENTHSITLPKGTLLYHQSVVDGIKELIPHWKLRGKSENGYLCNKPRIYLTVSKRLPKISTDNKLFDKLHTYEVINPPSKVFIDPLLPDVFQKAVYVETFSPLAVRKIE